MQWRDSAVVSKALEGARRVAKAQQSVFDKKANHLSSSSARVYGNRPQCMSFGLSNQSSLIIC
jgi:hypothetical protein